MLKAGKREPRYLTPRDHAFADGPVFLPPASLRAARSAFARKEDGELLWRIFESFRRHAQLGERVQLGLNARIVSLNAEACVTIGSQTVIRGLIRCESGGRVDIADTVYIGDDAIISAQSRVSIGEQTLVAHGVQIFDNDVHPTDLEERAAHFREIVGLDAGRPYSVAAAPVTIGRACWLGFGSAIMKGVTIGDGSIVAAKAVVVSDVPPMSVAAGNPARIVKTLQHVS